jgi:hypothetical protein
LDTSFSAAPRQGVDVLPIKRIHDRWIGEYARASAELLATLKADLEARATDHGQRQRRRLLRLLQEPEAVAVGVFERGQEAVGHLEGLGFAERDAAPLERLDLAPAIARREGEVHARL